VETPLQGIQRRQVWDIPPLALAITEHQIEQKKCPCCGIQNNAVFPTGVAHTVQYGSRVQALLVYLHHGQLLPYKRTMAVMRDLFGHTISQGTLANIIQRTAASVTPLVDEIKMKLLQSPVVHIDETGMDVLPKRQWVHVYSTAEETFYALHPKRGKEAIDAIDCLCRHFAKIRDNTNRLTFIICKLDHTMAFFRLFLSRAKYTSKISDDI